MQSQIFKILGAVIVPYVLCVVCYLQLGARISEQETRNRMLEQEDVRLSRLVEEVRGIYDAKRRLLSRIRVYEQVHRGGTQIVPILNVLALHIPEDMAIDTLEYSVNHPREPELLITGTAETTASVENFVSRLKPAAGSGTGERLPVSVSDVPDSALKHFDIRVRQSDINRLFTAIMDDGATD